MEAHAWAYAGSPQGETNLAMRKATAGRVSVYRGPAGKAADRAYFGPDYRSPSRASLRPWRLRARLSVIPPQTTPRQRHVPLPQPKLWQRVTSLVRALALHGVASRMRSHLASPLKPGRGVLIRSVSRRLGSVACVREDASPNEVPVLTAQLCPSRFPTVKPGSRHAESWLTEQGPGSSFGNKHRIQLVRNKQLT